MPRVSKRRKNGQVSIHSRAAKRATSPSIDTDKSLKSTKPPTETETRVLHTIRNGAGVGHLSHRRSKGKQMKRDKRLRLEKAMQRAEVILDQTERKVERSRGRGRSIRSRRVAWEDINDKLPKTTSKDTVTKKDTEDEDWEADEDVMSGLESEKEMVEGVNHLRVEDSADLKQHPIETPENPEADEIL